MSAVLEAPPSPSERNREPRGGKNRSEQPATSVALAEQDRATQRERILASFDPENLRWKNVSWVVLAWMTMMHVGALAAPFFFSWQAVGVAVVLHWLTCSIGICLCYHRTLSHRSLKLKGPARFFGLYAAAIAGEGSPLRWTMVHRIHHACSDHEHDPHSPLDGKWWSHLLWMFTKADKEIEQAAYQQYVPDLMKDKLLMFFERTWSLWMFGTAGLLYYFGGLPMLLWAVCVRMVVAYHSTWFVNSATHLWGYRNYETTDESRNLWWVAILSYGEGWHNNHHAHPRVARAGHRWWEIDPTWYAIKLLRTLGLATDVDDRVPAKSA